MLALPEAEEVRAGDKLTCSASHSETSFAFEFATKPIMEWEDEDDAGDEENGKKSLAQGARQISRWHWAMLMDRTRNDPYAEAIAKAARKATTVLDIGSGTGLLSMFAARAGAKEIYTVEGTEAMAKMAQRCIKKNGFEKQIKGYCMMSTEMEVGRELPRRCDLCISEIVDVGLLGEHALPSMAHARDHLLTPDAVAIPCGAMVHAFLFELPRQAYSLSRPLDTEGGVNLTPFNTFAYDKDSYEQCRMRDLEYTALTEPFDVMGFDLTGKTKYSPQKTTVRVTATKSGTVHAICMWFTLHLDEELSLSTAPWVENCWTQAVVFFESPLEVEAGTVVDVPVSHDVTKIYFSKPIVVSQ